MSEKVTYIHGTDPTEQARLSLLNRLTNDAFISFLNLKDHGRILEVGSGLGILAAEVATRNPASEVIGLEYFAEQLDVARRQARPNLQFVQGDAHKMPFQESEFDFAYCRYVLEHVSDPVQVLREMRRVVKPGGKVCAQENNILINVLDPECPTFDIVWKKFAILQSKVGGDGLVGRRLFSLFKDAGFNTVELSIAPEVHCAGSKTFAPWLQNLIGNIEGGAEALIENGLSTDGEIRRAIEEMRDLIQNPRGSTCFYWNRASAIR